MKNTGKDLLGDLKARAKKAIDTKRRETLAEQERLRLEALAVQAEQERLRLEVLAEQERLRLEVLAEQERLRLEALAEQERLRREALAERERLRREEASLRRLQEKARRRTEAFRLAKELCIAAAWQQQERVLFPEPLKEFRSDIAEEFGLEIGNLVVLSNTRFASDTMLILAHLEPTLSECFGIAAGASLFKGLLKRKLGDWDGQDPTKDIRDAISKALQYKSSRFQQVISEFCMCVQGELDAVETLEEEFIKNPGLQLQIESFNRFVCDYESFPTLPLPGKYRIAKEKLEALGVPVPDVREFFELASLYAGSWKGLNAEEDITKLRRLNEALQVLATEKRIYTEQLLPQLDHVICQVRKISQAWWRIEQLERLINEIRVLPDKKSCYTEHLPLLLNQLNRQVSTIPQTDETISIELGSIDTAQKTYLHWNTKDGNCSSIVALLHWLSGTKGQSLKQKLLAYFRKSADEGRKTASVTVAMRSSRAVICLKNLLCEVGFPCDMDDIACMLKSLGLPVSSRELESGEISFKFSW